MLELFCDKCGILKEFCKCKKLEPVYEYLKALRIKREQVLGDKLTPEWQEHFNSFMEGVT